jgi:hypothetical protein
MYLMYLTPASAASFANLIRLRLAFCDTSYAFDAPIISFSIARISQPSLLGCHLLPFIDDLL